MSDYNGSVVRAIRGPICLITIGALFALNNFTPYKFDQTWPVLLIVFGLLSLLKRGVETSTPPPPQPPPVASMPGGGFTGGRYANSPYNQAPPAQSSPASAAGSATEPSKGGFGSSATPRIDAPPSAPSGQGGTV